MSGGRVRSLALGLMRSALPQQASSGQGETELERGTGCWGLAQGSGEGKGRQIEETRALK